MKTQHCMVVLLSLMVVIFLAGCSLNKEGGGINPAKQKVTEKEITLNLTIPDYLNRVTADDFVGKYTGEVNKDGLPDGEGIFTTISRDGIHYIYEGSFKSGHFDGPGKFTTPGSEEVKEGTFTNDLLNGPGKITFKNGNKKNTIDVVFYSCLPMNPNIVEVNTDVNYANWTYKVVGVSTQKVIGNNQSTGDYLIVTIEAQNNSKANRDCDTLELASLKTGNVYRAESTLTTDYINEHDGLSLKNWYLSEFNSHEKRTVIYVFDIPANTDINDLVITPANNVGIGNPIKLRLLNSDTAQNNVPHEKQTSSDKIAVVVNCKEWITLRSTPSVEADSLAHIPLGTTVKYIEPAENGFYCIEYNGQRGYGLQSYLLIR